MNIQDFKKGDSITRTEVAKPYLNGITDSSYIGHRLIIIKVLKKTFHLKRTGEFNDSVFRGKPLILERDLWSEGWVSWDKYSFLKTKSEGAGRYG